MKILLTVHQFFPDYASGTEVLSCSVANELVKRGHEVRVLTGHPVADDRGRQSDEYEYHGIHVYRTYYRSCLQNHAEASEVDLRNNNSFAAQYFDSILDTFRPDIVHFFHLDRLGGGVIDSASRAGIPAFMTPTDFWSICPTGQMMLCDGSLCAGPSAHGGNCIKHVTEMTQKNFAGALAGKLPVWLFDMVAMLSGKAWVSTWPRVRDIHAISTWVKKNIKRLNQLNTIVSPNRFMSEQLIQHGISPDLLVESSFGVGQGDEKSDGKSKRLRQAARKPLRIGYIGTLAPHKGCHILVQAFRMLAEDAAVLKIYGKREDFPEYISTLQQAVGDSVAVEFCGTFPNAEIDRVLGDMDVLVVPSLWYENTPLVVYSAQQACCPVLASHLPGLSGVIEDGVNGLLFEAGNAAELCRALQRLIHEPDLVRQFSSHARAPKSTACYVDQLLEIWCGARE